MLIAELFYGLPILIIILGFVAGLAALTYGGNWLCNGAVALSALMRVTPIVIGLTVVAIATSMPEFFTSLVGSLRGRDGLAIGNIVGSNIANIGLIMGIGALISPLVIKARLIRIDVPIMIGISVLFLALCRDSLSRMDGAFLLLICAGYLTFMIRRASRGGAEDDAADSEGFNGNRSIPRAIACIALGTVALAIGADLLVQSGSEIARRLGVSDALIGLTVIAIGTSLPEFATTIVTAVKKQADICAGNIIGSNLFNIILISGAVAIIAPIDVDRRLLVVEFPAMIFFALLIWPIFITGRIVSRHEGLLLITFYSGFTMLTILWQLGRL